MTTCPYCGDDEVTDAIGHICWPPPDPGEIEYWEFCAREAARLEGTPKPEGFEVRTIHGSEGPRHDPYSFVEYRVTMPDGRWIVYHAGLHQELTVDGEDVEFEYDKGDPVFEALVGFPCDQLEWWADAPYRGVPCMACGCEGCRGGCCE